MQGSSARPPAPTSTARATHARHSRAELYLCLLRREEAGREAAGRLAGRRVVDTLLPRRRVEDDELARRRLHAAHRLRVAVEPHLQLLVVPPLAVVQLLRGVRLQDVPRHRVEDVEERLQQELAQVPRLQRRRLHVVALRERELRLAARRRRVVCEGRREGRVQHIGRVQVEAERRQVGAQRQHVEIAVRHADDTQQAQQSELVGAAGAGASCAAGRAAVAHGAQVGARRRCVGRVTAGRHRAARVRARRGDGRRGVRERH
mmetsp:Transcript_23269/g.81098  ORF Transcript_23269/g.81098 Transcript_23269/m.81098 type:complete len:261 (-) Transcript_23269:1189-1971(-)